jgi:uncharacterized protein YuzB (UPF0349 family)
MNLLVSMHPCRDPCKYYICVLFSTMVRSLQYLALSSVLDGNVDICDQKCIGACHNAASLLWALVTDLRVHLRSGTSLEWVPRVADGVHKRQNLSNNLVPQKSSIIKYNLLLMGASHHQCLGQNAPMKKSVELCLDFD